MAVGAWGNNGAAGTNSGHVRVWKWNGSAWSQRGGDVDGEAKHDLSGFSVALSSDGLVLAARAGVRELASFHKRAREFS